MRLSGKLTLTLMALSIATVGMISALIDLRAQIVLEDLAIRQLKAIRTSRTEFMRTYLDFLQSHSRNFAKNPMVTDATRAFVAGFDELRTRTLSPDDQARLRRHLLTNFLPAIDRRSVKPTQPADVEPPSDAARYLQLRYVVENPHPLDAKHLEHKVDDGTGFASAHAKYHRVFDDFRSELGYIDLLIVHPETAEIVYTVRKGVDFGANLASLPLSDSKLAAAVRKIRETKTKGAVEFVDFEPWPASYGQPSFFVVTGVFSDDAFVGILVLQVSDEILDQVVGVIPQGPEPNLGRTGEIYLVGQDSLMRSQSRFLKQDGPAFLQRLRSAGAAESMIRQLEKSGTAIMTHAIRPEHSRRIFGEQEGVIRGRGPFGQDIVASFGRIDFGGLSWGIVASMDQEEAASTISAFRSDALTSLVLAVVLAGLVSFFAGRALTQPLRQTILASRAFANGFFEVRLPVRSSDEIAELAKAFNEMASEIESKTVRLKTVIDENERLMEHMMPPLVLSRFHRKEVPGDSTPFGKDITLAFVEIKELDRVFDFFETNAALAMFDELFASFDEASVRLGMEKLGQVGTGYMVGCGLGDPKFDHTSRVLTFAQELQWLVDAFNVEHLTSVYLNIGVHRGPISTGRLGRHQFVNSLWKRTIELAREIDQSARKSGVRVSQAAFERVNGNTEFAFAQNEITQGEPGWTLLSFSGKRFVDA